MNPGQVEYGQHEIGADQNTRDATGHRTFRFRAPKSLSSMKCSDCLLDLVYARCDSATPYSMHFTLLAWLPRDSSIYAEIFLAEMLRWSGAPGRWCLARDPWIRRRRPCRRAPPCNVSLTRYPCVRGKAHSIRRSWLYSAQSAGERLMDMLTHWQLARIGTEHRS